MKILASQLKTILKRMSGLKSEQVTLNTTDGLAYTDDRELMILVESPALKAEAANEQQTITVNLRRLSAVTSRMSGELKVTPAERSLSIESGKSNTTLEVFKGKAALRVKGSTPISLPWPKLVSLFKFAAISAEADIAAEYGGVVQVSTVDDEYQVVSTNGNRLALATVECETPLVEPIYIPLSVIRSLSDLSAPLVDYSSTDSALIFSAVEGDLRITLQVAKLARKFPPYERIIPKTFAFSAILDPSEVKAALDTVGPMVGKEVSGTEDAGAVYLTFSNGKLTISSLGKQNRAEDTAPYASEEEVGDEIFAPTRTHMIRHDYLSDFFGSVKEPVTLQANEKNQPIMLTSGKMKALLSATVFSK